MIMSILGRRFLMARTLQSVLMGVLVVLGLIVSMLAVSVWSFCCGFFCGLIVSTLSVSLSSSSSSSCCGFR